MSARATLAATIALICATPTLAQNAPAADPKACAPGERLQPGEGSPVAPPGTSGQNLSDKLARTDGVICPPNVGSDIRLPTPPVGQSMPVIPPPGSPGGDPNVRPQ